MPTLEDVPLLVRIATQLDRVYEQQERALGLWSGYLSRVEKREEREEVRQAELAETFGALEGHFAELVRQLKRLDRTLGGTTEAALRARETHESRLETLEKSAMVRRRPGRRAEETEEYEEEERPPPPRRPGRFTGD